MTEEFRKTEGPDNDNTDHQGTETPKDTGPNEIEKKALELGWRPKEEWEGDEHQFIEADEFVRRQPLFDKIDSLSRRAKEQEKALRDLMQHHAKVQEVAYKKALEDLKSQYKTALAEGDADKVTELTEQIADAKATERARQVQQTQTIQNQPPHPDFVSWVDKNSWYAQDTEMRTQADMIGLAYANANQHMAPQEVLKYVEQRIRKVFPEKFTNPNKSKPSAVEASSKSEKPSKSHDDFDLTEEEQQAMKRFVRMGVMTEKQYKDELRKVRGA